MRTIFAAEPEEMTQSGEKPQSVVQITKQTAVSLALVVVIVTAAVGGAVSVTTLQNDVKHLTDTVQELKVELVALRKGQTSDIANNTSQISLLTERMRVALEREQQALKKIQDLETRLRELEKTNK
jgi:uncharacterized protein HemX